MTGWQIELARGPLEAARPARCGKCRIRVRASRKCGELHGGTTHLNTRFSPGSRARHEQRLCADARARETVGLAHREAPLASQRSAHLVHCGEPVVIEVEPQS